MGFLKRFFSIGSKKSRRKNQARLAEQVDANGRIVQLGEPVDGEATRLLRSASAHFAEPSETDYSLLPPLPHPINSVVNTPASSPAKSATSIQRRGTYTVKVLERKLEACTEFPNANPRLPDEQDPLADSPLRPRAHPRRVPVTPRDQSRLHCLRQDPSVASLLNMYDDNGRISSTAFSNTPQTPAPVHDVGGREQIKRSGSTLRQLLGDSPQDDGNDAAEGDISWAERFLGEHGGSTTSLALTNPIETPKDTHFPDDPSTKPIPSNLFFNSDLSQELSGNYPAISSLEVELSNATEAGITSIILHEETIPQESEPKTPMRASEVFGFLTERRKSILQRQRSQVEHTPSLPSLTRHSSDTRALSKSSVPPPVPSKTNNNSDTSDTSLTSSAQIHTATVTKLTPITNPLSRSTDTLNILYSQHTEPQDPSTVPQASSSSARVHHTGDSHSSVLTTSSHPSKIPRGPRPQPSPGPKVRVNINYQQPLVNAMPDTPAPRVKSHGSTRDAAAQHNKPATRTRIPKHVSQDPSTPARTRQQRRVTSHTSSIASNDDPSRISAPRKSRKADRAQRDKENSPPTAMPLRTIFDMRHPSFVNGDPPSPASSSELSPYTKEMMMNLRKQRMRTRDEMRHGSRSSRRQS
ncbi:hypothetical protein BDW22DRAFT_1394213 [Trametopsis cervina]|nr:hypothetical protein BDW22DRAFT_1394213 [Trametopsis cervina]